MKKFKVCAPLLGAIIILAFLAVGPLCPLVMADDTPRIGIIYPKTGIYSSLGPKHFDGLIMAIEDHGLLLGKKPKIFIRDSGTKASLAMSAAQELITREKVHIIIGGINTPINNSIATLADQHKIPFLYPSGGSIFMSGIGKATPHPQGTIKANPHPYMVYTWLNSVQRGFACLDVAELKGKKWYFVATDYAHGREAVGYAQKALRDKYGDAFKSLGVSWAKQGEVDYTTAITKAMSLKPDVVFVCLPGRFVQFQKQAASMGLMDKAHIHWSYGERLSASAAGAAAYGVTATVDYTVDNPKWALSNKFAERFYKRFGYWPGWPASSTYAGVRIFLMGIEKAGTLNGGKIMQALQGISNPNSITGAPFYIRGCDHKSVQPLYTVQWTKSDKYKPGYWKILKAYDKPDAALLPCSVKAQYDKLKY